MCILRYFPAIEPSVSNTTAVLWYNPAARRSKERLPRRCAAHRRYDCKIRSILPVWILPNRSYRSILFDRNRGCYVVLAGLRAVHLLQRIVRYVVSVFFVVGDVAGILLLDNSDSDFLFGHDRIYLS